MGKKAYEKAYDVYNALKCHFPDLDMTIAAFMDMYRFGREDVLDELPDECINTVLINETLCNEVEEGALPAHHSMCAMHWR